MVRWARYIVYGGAHGEEPHDAPQHVDRERERRNLHDRHRYQDNQRRIVGRRCVNSRKATSILRGWLGAVKYDAAGGNDASSAQTHWRPGQCLELPGKKVSARLGERSRSWLWLRVWCYTIERLGAVSESTCRALNGTSSNGQFRVTMNAEGHTVKFRRCLHSRDVGKPGGCRPRQLFF